MPESSSAPLKIMLLMLTSGLLLAAWSADGGNLPDKKGHGLATRTYSSGSAIAVLMQSQADDSGCNKHSSRSSEAKQHATAQTHADEGGGFALAAADSSPLKNLVAATQRVADCDALHRSYEPVVIDSSDENPVSVIRRLPIEAPLPLVTIEPVEAPVPVSVGESRPTEIVFTIASRIRADYRMSCWSCRQYCSTASRRVAAVCRQTRHSLTEFRQVLSRNVRRIDWKARLSSGMNDIAGQRN